MGASIRPVRPEDLEAIGDLHTRSRASAYAGLVPAEALDSMRPGAMVEWWTERWRWERDTHRLLVAESAGSVTGFTYLGPSETRGAAELYAIHVAPEHVGTGVGRALMKAALDELAKLRKRRAVLWVLDGNARARRFYERGGWTPDGGRRDGAIGNARTHQLRYSRPLP
jgi:GNAT superfamily N-acetyltransferase